MDDRKYQKIDKEQLSYWVACSLFFAMLAAAPLFFDTGFLNTRSGGDSPFLLFRLHQLYTALAEGVFPVRWMPDAAFGMGYPFFNYYASLPFYFAAGLKAIGFSYVLSLKLTHLGGFLVAGLGMFFWIYRVTDRRNVALLASIAYSFAPYHLVNVYVRGDSLVEFWAMAWHPLILLALHQAAKQPSARRIAWVGLSYGALAMTHNVSALIFSPFVAIYGIGLALSGGGLLKEKVMRALLLGVGGVLGLILAAWVWLPALGEQGYVQLGEQATGYFFYANHFRAADLVQPRLLFNFETNESDPSPFSMGLVQAILIALGTVYILIRVIKDRRLDWHTGFILFGLTLSTLMITPLSEPIWARVPLLPLTQFPWRFLAIQAVFGATIVGSVAPSPPSPLSQKAKNGERGKRDVGVVLSIIVGIVLAVAGIGGLRPNFIPITDADVTPTRLQWYESFSGNIGTTIRYEYLPMWTQPRPYASDILIGQEPRAKFLEGEGTASRIVAKSNRQTWIFTVESDSARVAIPTLYFPGWKVTNHDIQLRPVEGIGYIQLLDLPPGEYEIDLKFGRTPLRLGAELASLFGLVVLVLLIRPRRSWMPQSMEGWSFVAGSILSLVVVSMVAQSIPPRELNGLLNADFAQEAYFHHRELDAPLTSSQWVTAPQQAEQGGPIYTREMIPPTAGLYFRLLDSRSGALTASGDRRGWIYLTPDAFYYPQPLPVSSIYSLDIPPFGEVKLLAVDSTSDTETLQLRLRWQVLAESEKHYAIALRILDQQGIEIAALDTQAGAAGTYPTGLWEPGTLIEDAYRLSLPPGTAPGAYTLRVTLYDAVTLVPVGTTEIEDIHYESVSQTECGDMTRLLDDIGLGFIQLSASDEVVTGDPLLISAEWLACNIPDQVYQARWSLIDKQGIALFETVIDLASGSDPRLWIPIEGEAAFVLAKHNITMPNDLLGGDYMLNLQILSEGGDPVGEPHTVGEVLVIHRDRRFDVPDLNTVSGATFSDLITLWGYTLSQSDSALTLDVAWGALVDLGIDYKFFVHFFDPTTEAILTQLDLMPRAYQYPTSLWIEGETVDETLILDLSGIPSGEYRIAIGWYNPASGRLRVIGSDDDRLILDDVILIP